MQKGDYVFSVDLKSGYHHVDMDGRYWTYLGFYWEQHFYVFTQLPFGLAPACWAFTKITRELLYLWRSERLRNTRYLDNSAHMALSVLDAQAMQRTVFSDFEKAGFIVNVDKSTIIPAQQFKYLGAIVDTVTGTITVPDEKRAAVMKNINTLLANTRRCQVHAITSLVGTILSMSYSFGDIFVLMTRCMTMWVNRALADAHTFQSHIPLDAEAAGELMFWRQSFSMFDGIKPI
ncbi:hypothetical protein Vafri_21552 [Volvox africanus]|uniref:Reverse transcriptase domain-containing protein n=1 Tax=Volvox africanus TaxID=51714 RepID=A0A8J4BTF1_9CHLO|nr:hypothetical protein Vafri_21552 [Volvox africanus]